MAKYQQGPRPTKPLLPLRGVVVVTLAVNVPGPVAAARLSELGATVVKIEPPDGDPLQHYSSEWYKALTRGQKVIRLNLKQAHDRKRLNTLLRSSDLLLTASRPAALQRLSLGWTELHAKFPALSHVLLVGHRPPREDRAGHDLTYLATVGLLAPPKLPKTLLADLASSERIVSAALGLLLLRRRFRKGFCSEVIIEDVAAGFALPLHYGLTKCSGILGGACPQYGLYRARNRWIAVAALEPHFRKRLQEELQLKSLGHRRVSSVLRTRTAEQWERWARARDLPIVAVRDFH